MEHIKNTLKTRVPINDNNDNIKIVDNDTNDSPSKEYALNRSKFTPNTEETQLAEKIALSFNDLENYAFYRKVVNKLGIQGAYSFWKSHKEEEEEKKGGRYEFRNSKQYFAWKFKKGIYY
ncbi:MAG: hypothetical protein A2629_00240 [Candidatus Levybacteria bacterium RIFCSPHIGHO2_01_FULL_41_15]|nr:MAG: hypothetical protein A2629_00240 [Candidatus Levybacteria bacterium RIFCSPHIGHO2_01_FULL_41_15]